MNLLKRLIFFLTLYTLCSSINISAQKIAKGSVTGVIIESESQKSLEFANVVIRINADSTLVGGSLTDSNGKFILDNIPYGEYKITFSFVGYEMKTTPAFKVDASHKDINLGKLLISNSTKAVDEVVISGQKSTYVNSIDRKVFNVGKDLVSTRFYKCTIS